MKSELMFNRLLKLPLENKHSIFLFGPRGTGKTSWLKTNLPDALYFDLLNSETYQLLVANPARLEKLIPPSYDGWIIIDEVQKIPELLNEVHRLIEGKRLRFILTGSSARSLRRKGVNLLAGRAFIFHMHPLVAQEIGDSFDLSHAVRFGLLPMAVTSENPKLYLASYIQTYVNEEVLKEGLTRNIGAFSRFLEMASFSQGGLLNFSEIARETGLSRFAVANYFEILDDMLLSIRLYPFTKRAKRRMVAHEKFYFFDAGVYRSLRPRNYFDNEEEAEGAALETLFLQSVRALNDYLGYDYKIYFWRTSTNVEVDFILYGPKAVHAFEIKRSSTINNKSLRGLRSFAEDYPEAKLYVIFTGVHKEYHGNITAIPFAQALKELPEILK